MVRLEGLEPPTLSLGCSCSIQLSYRRGSSFERTTATGRSVADEAQDRVAVELAAAAEKAELDQEGVRVDDTAQAFHELGHGARCPSRRNDVVHDQDPLPRN